MADTENNKNSNSPAGRAQGKSPALRFPGFTEPWQKIRLGEIATFSKGAGISKDQRNEEGKPCILYGELYTTYTATNITYVISRTNLPEEGLIKSMANDVIIPSSGETAEDIATARCVLKNDVFLGGDLNIIRLNNDSGSFLCYQLNGVRKREIAKLAQGVSVVHLYKESLKSLVVSIPSIGEQSKIAYFLQLLDERIATQRRLIEDLEKLKSSIVDRIFSEMNGEVVTYRDILEISTQRNDDKADYRILSASQEFGMVERDSLDIDIKAEAKSVKTYKRVHSGDYVLHLRSFQGGLAFAEVEGICSPAYTILRPNKKLEYGYLKEYFNSSKFIKSLVLVTYGIRDGRSINVDEFLDMNISIHSKDNQAEIVKSLSVLSEKLRLEKKILCRYERQRTYLLNQLFI